MPEEEFLNVGTAMTLCSQQKKQPLTNVQSVKEQNMFGKETNPKFRCCDCLKEFEMDDSLDWTPSDVVCMKCKSLYSEWINYLEYIKGKLGVNI